MQYAQLNRRPESEAKAPHGAGIALGEQTSALLRRLTSTQEQILRMLYGMNNGIECTIEEVGRQVSLTPERVRLERDHALRKLR